jgi:hypothetical protein
LPRQPGNAVEMGGEEGPGEKLVTAIPTILYTHGVNETGTGNKCGC